MIEAVLFDLDDTLLDHATAMAEAVVRLHAHVNTAEPFESFRDRWRASHARHYPGFLCGRITYEEAVLARVRETIDSAIDASAAEALFTQYLGWYEASWQLFDDVLPALDGLRGLPLGVISNGRATEQRHKLRVSSIYDRFAVILISEDIGVPKPDAEIFRRACQSIDVKPAGTLYVGDQYDLDAVGARDAGLQGVWLDRQRKASFFHQLPIIDSLDQLTDLVRNR